MPNEDKCVAIKIFFISILKLILLANTIIQATWGYTINTTS
jgi:hypothetical protein